MQKLTAEKSKELLDQIWFDLEALAETFLEDGDLTDFENDLYFKLKDYYNGH